MLKAQLRSGGGRRVGRGDAGGGSPVVRQQLREVALLERGQTLEHVLEVGPGVVTVELGRLDQAHNHGRALAGLLRAHKEPIIAIMVI